MTPTNWPADHPAIIYPSHDYDPFLGGTEIVSNLSFHSPEVIFWYDKPIMFSGIWQGQPCLVNMIDEGEPNQPYKMTTFRACISTPTAGQILDMRENRLYVRDACLAGDLFIVEAEFGKYGVHVLRAWRVETLSDDDLPERNIFLSPR